jgi:hypothetical protein
MKDWCHPHAANQQLIVFSAHMLFAAETLYSIGLHHIGFGGTEPVLSGSSNKQSRKQ